MVKKKLRSQDDKMSRMPANVPKMDNIDFSELDADESSRLDKMMLAEQQSSQDNVKELFHEDKVKARTDISARQIKLVTKAFYLAKITGMKEIYAILNDFLTLSISKDRKSRAEYVEGLKARIMDSMRDSANIRGQFGK